MTNNEIEELVHLYEDGAFNRRELLKRVAGVTGSTATAAAALLSLGVLEKAAGQEATPGCPENAPVPADASDLQSFMVDYPGPGGKVIAYYSQPAGNPPAQLPAVVVIHENRGLTDHIKDVARRVARAGYVGLAVDLPVDQLDNLQVPVLLHYAELDRNFTGMVPAALSGLVSKRKTFSLHIYEGVSF